MKMLQYIPEARLFKWLKSKFEACEADEARKPNLAINLSFFLNSSVEGTSVHINTTQVVLQSIQSCNIKIN